MFEPKEWLQLGPANYVSIQVGDGGMDLAELSVEAWFRSYGDPGSAPSPLLHLRGGPRRVDLNAGRTRWGSQLPDFFGYRIEGVGDRPQEAWLATERSGPIWQHVAWVVRKTTGHTHRLDVYVDGKLFMNGRDYRLASGFPEGVFEKISIGSGGFAGDLAHVRLWSRGLSEIAVQHNALHDHEDEPPESTGSLAGWWKMNDLTGNPVTGVPDSSGNGRNGTIEQEIGGFGRTHSAGQARSRGLRGGSG